MYIYQRRCFLTTLTYQPYPPISRSHAAASNTNPVSLSHAAAGRCLSSLSQKPRKTSDLRRRNHRHLRRPESLQVLLSVDRLFCKDRSQSSLLTCTEQCEILSLLDCLVTRKSMLTLTHSLPVFTRRLEFTRISHSRSSVVVCGLKGPRPRYPRVWKANKKIGTISKSLKLVECIKGLSNVKEEVYGALDSFIAWELEFPLITVKKALRTLENQKDWKRIIQVAKWMLSKGQGRTMGTYFTLLNALAADGRVEEAEELWTKLFKQYLDSMPRTFFDKMVSIYYERGMHDKMFEIFADMEELGIKPNMPIVNKVGDVFQKLGMMDKYAKLKKKYPPPKWEIRYIKGKRVRIQANKQRNLDGDDKLPSEEMETIQSSKEVLNADSKPDEQIVEALDVDQNSSNLLEEAGTSSDSDNKTLSEEKETVQSSIEVLNADSNQGEQIVEALEVDQNSSNLLEEAGTSFYELRVESKSSS